MLARAPAFGCAAVVRLLHLGWLFGCLLLAAFVARGQLNATQPASAWVVDQAKVLSSDDVATLDALGDAVHAADANAALFVVTVETTGGANPRRFATDLLNRFGPHASLRSGVIVFIAMQDRRAELVLGDDLFVRLGTTASDRIVRDVIVARMKQHDPRGAILGAAKACAQEYFGVQPADPGPIEKTTASGTAVPAPNPVAHPAHPPAVLPPIERPRAPPVPAQPLPRNEFPAGGIQMRSVRPASANFLFFLAPVIAVLGLTVAVVVHQLGRRARRCPHCGAAGCSRTRRTTQAATTSSTGLEEVTTNCSGCGYHGVSLETLAMLSAASSWDSSSSSSSSSFDSSSNSSSSDSGSSSSGGGSSGSW